MRWKSAFCSRCNAERPLRRNPARKGGGPRSACAVCGEPVHLDNVKGAKPTTSVHSGAVFQSKEESKREPELLAQQRAGVITDLRAAAYTGDHTTERYRLEVFGNGAVEALIASATRATELLRGAPPVEWRLAIARELEARVKDLYRARHKITTYRPDYTYRIVDGGRLVVEDIKVSLHRQQHFLEKRRLMVACHDIEVQTIYGSGRNLFGRMR